MNDESLAEWEQDDDPLHYYANEIRHFVGPYDLTIDFGLIAGNGPKHLVRITLAPEKALELQRLLSDALRDFRNAYGQLRDPHMPDVGDGNGGVGHQ